LGRGILAEKDFPYSGNLLADELSYHGRISIVKPEPYRKVDRVVPAYRVYLHLTNPEADSKTHESYPDLQMARDGLD
jgi:hypothetical protein